MSSQVKLSSGPMLQQFIYFCSENSSMAQMYGDCYSKSICEAIGPLLRQKLMIITSNTSMISSKMEVEQSYQDYRQTVGHRWTFLQMFVFALA